MGRGLDWREWLPPQPTSHAWTRQDWRALAILLAGALTLRLVLGALFPSMHWPDEVFQATEQSYRLLTGTGVVPWEFREGARNWLLPLMLTGALWPVLQIFGSGPPIYYAAMAFCAAFSLIGVASAFAIGRRISLTHAILAGFAVATWSEMIYFSLRPLGEALAANLLIASAFFVTGKLSRSHLAAAGFLLAACFALRFHLAPALALFGGYALLRGKPGDIAFLFMGAIAPLAALALVDWVFWGAPFHSIFVNAAANAESPDRYGVSPPHFFIQQWLLNWGGAFPFMVLLTLIGARKQPLLLAAALIIVLEHSLVPHKEQRFILPAVMCAIVLSGLGIADLMRRLVAERYVAIGAASLLGITSFCIAMVGEARSAVWSTASNSYTALWRIGADPDVCGVAIAGGLYWVHAPGQSSMAHPAPLYPEALAANGPSPEAYNYVMATPNVVLPDAFHEVGCHEARQQPRICVYRREGSCRPEPQRAMNAYLAARGD